MNHEDAEEDEEAEKMPFSETKRMEWIGACQERSGFGELFPLLK